MQRLALPLLLLMLLLLLSLQMVAPANPTCRPQQRALPWPKGRSPAPSRPESPEAPKAPTAEAQAQARVGPLRATRGTVTVRRTVRERVAEVTETETLLMPLPVRQWEMAAAAAMVTKAACEEEEEVERMVKDTRTGRTIATAVGVGVGQGIPDIATSSPTAVDEDMRTVTTEEVVKEELEQEAEKPKEGERET
jgi:hypothetical protein